MTTKTRFRIYYIDPITTLNNLLNFREPSAAITTEKTATLNVGAKTPTDLATEIERALNDAGEFTYTVAFNRAPRTFTISATAVFELLAATGTNIGLSPFSLIGFSADETGLTSYEGTESGSSYTPQFLPQSFLSFDDNIEGTEASINQSASGKVETVTFGDTRFMEFELKYITNTLKGKGNPVLNNPTGLSEARSLMEFLVKKREVEFMIDESNTSSFDTILLESTQKSRAGVGYQLKDMVKGGLDDHFETGKLKFRRI